METYLYFRKFRPATFTHTNDGTGQALTTITGLGGDDIDSITEVASLVVVPNDGANSNIGSGYTHPGAGGSLTLDITNGAVKTCANSVITLNNNSEDADSGYTLEDDDQVIMTFQQGLETCFFYPASGLLGMEATATGQTTLRFKSLKGDGTDDVVAINHDNGQYQNIVNGFNAIIGGRKSEKGIVSVIDGSGGKTLIANELRGLGIDGLIYTPEGSY